ncbi:ABC transporter permease [Cesiribacter andamanensis]|uniref:Macrolide export ATP-binding/permease protein MacB n=1 Tax=Cesiribacter andamanensis AMV16 TaxID=1279009 RepID=M7NQA2_9BACT|nr:FtsX-like permease family protein [Cesiribacter andamanensis]EMR00699.1 Macrolide export ATP-binding/permease protein MacB [Cesiribacter andamanensis AMV16]
MLRNYLKMALKVLNRRRFYTFISMFGITITLAILLIVSAFWNHLVGQHEPEVNLDRSLVVFRMKLQGKDGWTSTSANSDYFLEKYVRKLQTPEMMTFYSLPSTVNTFVDGQKVNLDRKYTDATFWQVMQHTFIEGRPYTDDEVQQRHPVVVISRASKEELFGMGSALGQEIKIDEDRYKVVGVIDDTPITRLHSYGNLFIPITLNKGYGKDKEYMGEFVATLVASSREAIGDMEKEYEAMARQIENPDPANVEKVLSSADSYVGAFSRMFLGGDGDSGVQKLYAILMALAFLFMLLPTVNLMNINISRIMERASEIGVRRAFGASTWALLFQFIIENLVLTLLCGLLAVLVAWGGLQLINTSGLVQFMELKLNFHVLGAGLLFTLVFGLISGVYPAWRMSRLQAAEALKAK